MKGPPSSIVFDLFHTLVDPEDFRPKEFRRAEKAADMLGVDRKEFELYWSKTLSLRNTDSSWSVVRLVQEYLAKLGKESSPVVLARIDYEMGRYQDQAILQPRADVISALKSLLARKLKLGLLSNSDEREVREWPRSPMAEFFDAVCFSCEIGCVKPDLRAFETVLARLAASPAGSLYVGNGGSDELDGARRAGFGLVVFMKGFVARNGLRRASELGAIQKTADVSVDSLQELSAILDGAFSSNADQACG